MNEWMNGWMNGVKPWVEGKQEIKTERENRLFYCTQTFHWPWNFLTRHLSMRSHMCTPWVATLRRPSLPLLSSVKDITGWSSWMIWWSRRSSKSYLNHTNHKGKSRQSNVDTRHQHLWKCFWKCHWGYENVTGVIRKGDNCHLSLGTTPTFPRDNSDWNPFLSQYQ